MAWHIFYKRKNQSLASRMWFSKASGTSWMNQSNGSQYSLPPHTHTQTFGRWGDSGKKVYQQTIVKGEEGQFSCDKSLKQLCGVG